MSKELLDGQSGIRSSESSGFLLLLSFHHCSLLIFPSVLFLSEEQMGKDWEPRENNVWKSEALERKVLCASRAHREIQSYFILISLLFHLFLLFPVFDLN
jgi:hypothetical protein